jgi:hypothetical protein
VTQHYYAIHLLDPNGTVTNWNAGGERIKGLQVRRNRRPALLRRLQGPRRASVHPIHARSQPRARASRKYRRLTAIELIGLGGVILNLTPRKPRCVKSRLHADSAESFSQTSSSAVTARSLTHPEMQFGRIVFSTFCPRATFYTA